MIDHKDLKPGWYWIKDITGDRKGCPWTIIKWVPDRNNHVVYGSIIAGPFTLNEIVRWWKGKTK